jgi:mRNA interferase RelE/StbE
MLAIRLPEPIELRLAALAETTGRTKTTLAREAILEFIDDLEDFYLAEARARKNRKTIPLDPDAVKDLKKLDKQVQVRILDFLRTRLGTLANPRELGEPLAGSKLGNYWKYRVGDWRIICDLQDQRIVVRVLRVGNRREVYR